LLKDNKNGSEIEGAGILEFLASDQEFKRLMIALTHTNSGFLCYTTPTAYGQEEVAQLIKQRLSDKAVAFWDGSRQKKPIDLTFFTDLTTQFLDAKVYILSNFHLCAKAFKTEDNFFQMLNFTRDPLASLKKLFLFGMTKEFAQQIALKAPDFRSFFLAKFHFEVASPKRVASEALRLYAQYPSSAASQYARELIIELMQPVLNWLAGNSKKKTPALDDIIFSFLETWNIDESTPKPDEIEDVTHVLMELQKVMEKQKEKRTEPHEKLRFARQYCVMASSYQKLTKYSEADVLLREAMQIIIEVQGEQSSDAGKIYELVAENAMAMQDYIMARKLFDKTLIIWTRLNEMSGVARVYYQLGRLAEQTQDLDTAERLYHECLIMMLNIGNENDAAITYYQLGRVAEKQERFNEAEGWYQQSLKIAMRLGDEKKAATIFNQLGNIALERRDFDAAEDWYKKSLEIVREHGNEYVETSILNQLEEIAAQRQEIEVT